MNKKKSLRRNNKAPRFAPLWHFMLFIQAALKGAAYAVKSSLSCRAFLLFRRCSYGYCACKITSAQLHFRRHCYLLLSGKSFLNDKIRLKSCKRVSALFVTLVIAKNISTLTQSTHFAGQQVYNQVINCWIKPKFKK